MGAKVQNKNQITKRSDHFILYIDLNKLGWEVSLSQPNNLLTA